MVRGSTRSLLVFCLEQLAVVLYKLIQWIRHTKTYLQFPSDIRQAHMEIFESHSMRCTAYCEAECLWQHHTPQTKAQNSGSKWSLCRTPRVSG